MSVFKIDFHLLILNWFQNVFFASYSWLAKEIMSWTQHPTDPQKLFHILTSQFFVWQNSFFNGVRFFWKQLKKKTESLPKNASSSLGDFEACWTRIWQLKIPTLCTWGSTCRLWENLKFASWPWNWLYGDSGRQKHRFSNENSYSWCSTRWFLQEIAIFSPGRKSWFLDFAKTVKVLKTYDVLLRVYTSIFPNLDHDILILKSSGEICYFWIIEV